MDHTGLPLQTSPYLPLPCERSLDGATWTADIWFSSLLIYRPRKDEKLRWPSWLTYSGRYTHISGHTSATDWAEARESSPVRDRRSNHWATQPTNRWCSPPATNKWATCHKKIIILLLLLLLLLFPLCDRKPVQLPKGRSYMITWFQVQHESHCCI